MDAQRHLVAVKDVEHVENVPDAAYKADLGDVHGAARLGVRSG
ncbi:hypothetical protein OG528_31475 [Streptomyces platensis]